MNWKWMRSGVMEGFPKHWYWLSLYFEMQNDLFCLSILSLSFDKVIPQCGTPPNSRNVRSLIWFFFKCKYAVLEIFFLLLTFKREAWFKDFGNIPPGILRYKLRNSMRRKKCTLVLPWHPRSIKFWCSDYHKIDSAINSHTMNYWIYFYCKLF